MKSPLRSRVIRSATPVRKVPTAFTLVELIVVITILAVLATVGFLSLQGYTKDASKSAVKANLKTLAQAVSSESAKNGDSPRRYIVHSGALVLSGATFSGTALVPGPFTTPGTNYSAGTADFGALRADPSKFKNPDGTAFFFAALDWSESLPSGKTRSRSFFQVAGFPESGTGTVAVEGDYPASVGGSSAGLIATSSGSSTAFVDASSSSSSSSGGGGGATRYAGCDTDDITLSNGQVWAACNVGAQYAYTGAVLPSCAGTAADCASAYRDSIGSYFQWGRNDDVTVQGTPTSTKAATGTLAGGVGHSNFITAGGAPNDWIFEQNGNLWGGSGTTSVSGTFASRSAWDQAAMKGPCAIGYHVPTALEWATATANITGFATGAVVNNQVKRDLFVSTLKLPMAGTRMGTTASYLVATSVGFYVASSPSGTDAYLTNISATQVAPVSTNNRSMGYSVRCLKN